MDNNQDHFNVLRKINNKPKSTQENCPKSYVLSDSIRITKTSYFKKFLNNKSHLNSGYVVDFNSCIGFKMPFLEAFDVNTYSNLKLARVIFNDLSKFKFLYK